MPSYALSGSRAGIGSVVTTAGSFNGTWLIAGVGSVTEVSSAPPPTYARVTQVALEQWIAPLALAQVTQVALEEWASVASLSPLTGGSVGVTPPSNRSSGNAGANSIFLTQVTAQQNSVANAVLIDLSGAVSGINFRPLIYDGAHSVLLATGVIVQSLASDYNRLPLPAPFAVTAGTSYWIGYVCDSSLPVTAQAALTNVSWWASGGQSVASPANPLAAGSASTNSLMIALELDGAGALPFGFATDRSAGVALSGFNRVATFPATGSQGARSSFPHLPSNGGKWYAEVDIGGTPGNNMGVGLAATAWGVIQGALGLTYVGMLHPDGNTSTAVATGLLYGAGDTVGIAWDAVNNLMWWNVNNGAWCGSSSTAGNPVTGTLGQATETTWPCTITVGTGSVGAAAVFTLRDTADALRYTPPSGYAAWSSYLNPTYIPPPPIQPSKGQDKGKGGPKVKIGPPALRSEGKLEFLPPPQRRRVYAPWGIPPVLGQALAESAVTSTALAATVVRLAALAEGSATSAAVSSGRLIAALLAEGATATSAVAASLKAAAVLAASSQGVTALSGKATIHAALTAGATGSDAPRVGVPALGTLAEGAATSAVIAALLTARGALTGTAAASAVVAGFRTLVAGLAETGHGSDASTVSTILHGLMAEGSATASQVSAVAHLLATIAEAARTEDDPLATKIVHVAINEATLTAEIDAWIATTRPFRGSQALEGRMASPDLKGHRSSPNLSGHRSSPNLHGDKDA